jgi:hypothetical protein
MTVVIQDGRRSGHLSWALDSMAASTSSGVVISPFHTPRVARPYHRAASDVSHQVRTSGGEAIFDATTHARLLPGSNDLAHYTTWQLWGPAGVGLDSDEKRLQHVERVFEHQTKLEVPLLAPTLTLESSLGDPATAALETARAAAAISPTAWQSLAGTRTFWRGGVDLDAYIGQLAALRSPAWALTLVNGVVVDNAPDLDDTEAIAGLLRTIHSLSLRSRVILMHADVAGLIAVGAGANTLGAGWDRGMRYFDPTSFQLVSPGVRIPASYVTQGGLAAVLRRDTGEALGRLPNATQMRAGPMPIDDGAERAHHLAVLNEATGRIAAHGSNRGARIAEARGLYEQALAWWDTAKANLPRGTMPDNLRTRWLTQPLAALQHYAEAESLW